MEDSTLLTLLVALLVVSLGALFVSLQDPTVEVEVDLSEVNEKLDTVIETLETPVESEVTDEIVGDYMLTKSEYEDEITEVEALRLAELSVNLDDRDFRKALFKALLNFSIDIDDRDDITEVRYETDVDGNKVDFDRFRVWYFLDGDEEEVEKAKLDDFTVIVKDLDFDDNFDDAEVNEDYFDELEVLKVYN